MFIDHVGDIQGMLTLLLAYVLTITPAGWARAYTAKKLGDDTPEQMGFLSFDPVDHFDPVGFLFLVFSRYLFGFIIGWGRHIPINSESYYEPHARLKYAMVVCSDVIVHLLLATLAMATLAFLFEPSMQMTVYCLAMILLFSGATPSAIDGINLGSLPSSFMLSLGYVLSVFFYLNIFFAVISLVSTIIMNIMTFLLNRFDIERYYFVVLLSVMILAALLGGLLKPVFWQLTMMLGNKCAMLIKVS